MFPRAGVNRMKDQLTNHMSTTNTQNKGRRDKGVHFDKYPNKEQCLVNEKENFHPPTRPFMFFETNKFWFHNKHTCREVSPGLDSPPERSEVSSGNFQPPEVRPIPDSPNLQVCLVFIPCTEPYTL
jgi:hypothetical protein